MHFRVLSRRVRQASLSFRKQRLHALIDRAATAARCDQMTEIYSICRQLAPKTRRERVSIRGEDGSTLEPKAQFHAVVKYFRAAFSHPNPVGYEGSCAPPDPVRPCPSLAYPWKCGRPALMFSLLVLLPTSGGA